MAKVIERFELHSLDEIAEIKQTITPIMKGQATKERILLIASFVRAVEQIEKDPTNDQNCLNKTLDLLRSFVIELILAIRNSNQKIRTGAQEAFLNMAKILAGIKALP